MRQDALVRAGQEFAPAALGVAAFAAVLAGVDRVGVVLAGATLVVLWLVNRSVRPGALLPVRLTLAATVTTALGDTAPPVVTGLIGLILVGLLATEPLLARITRAPFVVAGLPVPVPLSARLGQSDAVPLAHSVLVAVVGAAAAGRAGAMAAAALALAFVAAVGQLGLVAAGLSRWRGRHRAERDALRRGLLAHKPRFMLYFSAPPGSEYQAAMWLPQLDRIEEPYVVVLGETENLPAIRALTRMPVVVAADSDLLDTILVPGLTTVFYVNNAMKNTHCVRYTGLTHVQLYHGDSDKTVTTNPVNAMYDVIFVAGQAAIDRFAARGVRIPAEKFRIVGRPQVAQLDPAPRAAGHHLDSTTASPVVLYAPTWVGAYGEPSHCSLPIAESLVTALLGRGATVILRPHPYSRRDPRSAGWLRRVEHLLAQDRVRSGRRHRFGADVSTLSLHECMNLSDAMVCDVSAVASDFLYTMKPFALTDMTGRGASFTEAMPLARAAYVIDGDGGNIGPVLDDLLGVDPLAQQRSQLRSYYLGDFPHERYADAFLNEARRCIAGQVEPVPVPTAGLS